MILIIKTQDPRDQKTICKKQDSIWIIFLNNLIPSAYNNFFKDVTMHSSVLAIGVSNREELEKAMEPFFQLGCTMSQEEQAEDPRAELEISFTKEEAEKDYKEDKAKCPTAEQLAFFRDNFIEPSDEDTCREIYKEKHNNHHAPNGYSGDDFAYGSYKMANGESDFFFISEENMTKLREWTKEHNISFWNLESGQTKKEFVEKYPDAHTFMTASGSEYIWSEELQGYGYYGNPNGFWDWYQVGGRWVGFFAIKEEKREEAKIGDPAWNLQIGEDDIEYLKKRADVLKVGDIDFNAMEENSKKHSADQWDKMWKIIKDSKDKSEEEIDKRFREIINATEDETREEYIERTKSFGVAAIVHAGEWFEHDNDGYYTCKSNKLKGGKIAKDLPIFLKNMHEDTPLMLVDCHG